MFFSNLKIRTRLWVSFGTMMLIMAAIVATGVVQMRTMDAAFSDAQLAAKNDKLAVQISEGINNMRGLQLSALVSLSEERMKELQRVTDLGVASSAFATELEKSEIGVDTKKIAGEILASTEKYRKGHEQVMRFADLDQVGDMNSLIQGEQRAAQRAAITEVDKYRAIQDSRRAVAGQRAEQARANAESVMYVLLAGALAIAVAMAVLITRSIGSSLSYAVASVEHVAQGDLSASIDASAKDETGQLLSTLQGMQAALGHTVSTIKTAADAVGLAAQEIAQGQTNLSARTEEQAASLEQAAASMEQMTTMVSQNAENAKMASQHALAASDVAERGGQVVGTVVTTMSGISSSSKKIADITGVIDGIAFQTNILALNAAVEAARAGEQGRGFAVVASEVRSLAQRSASAAKEIRLLISDSMGRIQAGSQQVAEAGETMGEIVASVKRVTGLIEAISSASQEQSLSLAQVSDTVQQLEKVTQQNAAMGEEAAAASVSLEEQATALTRAVGSFKLAQRGPSATAPA